MSWIFNTNQMTPAHWLLISANTFQTTKTTRFIYVNIGGDSPANHIQINRTHATKERGIFPYVLNIEIYTCIYGMVWFWAWSVCIWSVDDQCKLSSMRIDCFQSRTKQNGMSSNPKNALKDALIKCFGNESMQKWSRLSFNYTKTICKKSQRALTTECLTKRSDTLNIQQQKKREPVEQDTNDRCNRLTLFTMCI